MADLIGLEREACAIFSVVCGDAEYMTKEQVHFVALAAGMRHDVDWETEYAVLLAHHRVDAYMGWTVVDFKKLLEQKCQGDAGRAFAHRALVECVLNYRTPHHTITALRQVPSEAQRPAQRPAPPTPVVAPTPPPPPPALPLVVQPRTQPVATQGRCSWHQPLGEFRGNGFGNGRQLPVHHVDYNDYSDVGRLIQLNTHLEATLFFLDQRGWDFLQEKTLKHVVDGDLSVVACMTQAHRFVKYECRWCGDYVAAKHGKHEQSQTVAEGRCKVLWYFQFTNEMDQRRRLEKPTV